MSCGAAIGVDSGAVGVATVVSREVEGGGIGAAEVSGFWVGMTVGVGWEAGLACTTLLSDFFFYLQLYSYRPTY